MGERPRRALHRSSVRGRQGERFGPRGVARRTAVFHSVQECQPADAESMRSAPDEERPPDGRHAMDATQTYETIKIEKNGDGITWLYLNRPEKRNAMNPLLHEEMVQALDELSRDDETRVLVLSGAGTAFCAGMDIKEHFRELGDDRQQFERVEELSQRWRWRQLSTFPRPTIAMVNGWCCGGAFTPLINCDFAIAAEEAQFSLSEINWGILPGGLVSKMVTDILGWRDAMYLSLTGEAFDGRRAA